MIKDCYCRGKGLKQFFGTLLQNVPHQFAHHFENRIVQSFHVSAYPLFMSTIQQRSRWLSIGACFLRIFIQSVA